MYIVSMGNKDGVQVYFGPFDNYVEANRFLNVELCPKGPANVQMRVIAVQSPEYVTSRKIVSFVGM